MLRTREIDLRTELIFHKASSSLVPSNHSLGSWLRNHLLAQGQTQGSMLQQRTNKTLTTSPFGNTCEVDEVSPEVEAGVVAGLRCLQPETQICDYNT